ncbi:MAG: F0F1 ATP synthase subunit B [Phycisphaerae bacterium]|nr:F0F1 ATP synthase subunit B [Phycisphaerae bacterium]
MRTIRMCDIARPVAALFLSMHALASRAVAAEGEGQGNLFAGDLGNAIWTLLIFGLVVFVLGRFVWPAILGGLRKREEFILQSLQQAKKDRQEAEARLKEYAEKLDAARAEASGIVDEGRRDAEVVKRQIEENARKEAEAIVTRARREISIATESAVKELYELSGKLATELASRIIRKELDPKEHERLIADSIRELSDTMKRN